METGRLPIPIELRHPYFFPEKEWIPKKELAVKLNLENPFLHELAFYSKIPALKPWEAAETSIPALIAVWMALEESLKGLFRIRDKSGVQPGMKKGIGLLVEILFWSNGQPAKLTDGISFTQLKMKPANIEERFNFLLERPHIYPAFIQLAALMAEQEKQFFKMLATTRNRKSAGHGNS